jgi:hypothetical protein
MRPPVPEENAARPAMFRHHSGALRHVGAKPACQPAAGDVVRVRETEPMNEPYRPRHSYPFAAASANSSIGSSERNAPIDGSGARQRRRWGNGANCVAVLLALAVAACAYRPPNSADLGKPSYQADLAECKTYGEREGHRRVLAYGGLFLTYPISLPIEEWRQTRKCMVGKGYVAQS